MANFPFPNKISQESKRTANQKVVVSNYGDGFQQRAAVGLNSRYDSWAIQLTALSLEDRNTLSAFYESHGMVVAFDWTPPNGTATKWVFASPLEETNVGTYYTFTFTLNQVFE